MFRKQSSVYERLLGDRIDELDPVLRRYFGPLPEGAVGRGRGTFDVAGSRLVAARPLLALLARRDLLFPEYARNVPFSIENRSDGDGLRAVRTFHLPGVDRRMRDRMEVRRGRLIDRLGRRGGLEVELAAMVVDGGMRLVSTSLAWRVGRARIPLPRFARVTVSETSVSECQHVDVRLRAPLAGEVFRYSGTFEYRIEPRPELPGARPGDVGARP